MYVCIYIYIYTNAGSLANNLLARANYVSTTGSDRKYIYCNNIDFLCGCFV